MHLQVDELELEGIVRRAVVETVHQLQNTPSDADDRLAFTEPEAAAMLGVAPHVLRDCRLRGEVIASKIGRRVVYERSQLVALLARRRLGG